MLKNHLKKQLQALINLSIQGQHQQYLNAGSRNYYLDLPQLSHSVQYYWCYK